MQISVEHDNPNKSSAVFYWLLMKYHWTHHAVCLTDLSWNQLLCPKTLVMFPLSGDFQSRARQPRNRSSFTDVHFWTSKYMGHKTNFADFVFNNPNKFFFWFLKFVYLNVYSTAWIPVWGDLRLSVGSFSWTPTGNRASSKNRSKERSKEVYSILFLLRLLK